MIKQFWDWFTNQQLTLRKIIDGERTIIYTFKYFLTF
jgi:hypothetical protein